MAKMRIVLRGHLPQEGRKEKDVQLAALKKQAVVPDGKDRLNLQIDEDLKKWAQEYARRHHTSLTQIIIDHLVVLRKQEDGEGVDQI
jgi:predicted nuclease of restriction endonuclease-like RecB superfamily